MYVAICAKPWDYFLNFAFERGSSVAAQALGGFEDEHG